MKSSAFVVKDASAPATAIKAPAKAPKVGGVQLVARETVSMWGHSCTVYDRDAPPPWEAVFDLPGFRNILTYPVVFVLKESGNVTPAAFRKMLTSFIIEGPAVDESDSDDEAEPLAPPLDDDDDGPAMDEDAAADFDGDVSTGAEESESNDDDDYDEPEPDFS